MLSMRPPILVGILLWSLASAAHAQVRPPSEETIEFFRLNCASCHTIGGGRLAGPDLKDVTKRKDREWLNKFMRDPKGVIDSGDEYAQKLFREYNNVYMQQVPGLTKALADKILDLIVSESSATDPLFAGLKNDRPLTKADIVRGRRLFLGTEDFASGAPACVSCHTVKEISALGGGSLGPDLTNAFARLEGRQALAAWLSAPPSEVMRPVYKKHRLDSEERLALVAYLKEVGGAGESARNYSLEFVLAGFAAAALLLVLFDFLWRARYRDTRRALVRRHREQKARA